MLSAACPAPTDACTIAAPAPKRRRMHPNRFVDADKVFGTGRPLLLSPQPSLMIARRIQFERAVNALFNLDASTKPAESEARTLKPKTFHQEHTRMRILARFCG